MPTPCEPPCTMDDSKRLLRIVAGESEVPVKLAMDTGHQCAVGVGKEDNDVYAWVRSLPPTLL